MDASPCDATPQTVIETVEPACSCPWAECRDPEVAADPPTTTPILVLIEAEQSGRARGLRFRMAEIDHEIWDLLTSPPARAQIEPCGIHEHTGATCMICDAWAARFGCPIGAMLGDGWSE